MLTEAQQEVWDNLEKLRVEMQGAYLEIRELKERIEILEKRKPPQIPMHTRFIG